MREIRFQSLFRGRLLDPRVWVTGNLLISPDGTNFICFAVEDAEILDKYEVDPATVGQYTGLNDKHGRMIFEGDITLARITEGTYKCFEWPAAVTVFDGGAFCRKEGQREAVPFRSYAPSVELEVIGNIYDNAEMGLTE